MKKRKTPREKLREQLEEAKRDIEDLPDWIREMPPDFRDNRFDEKLEKWINSWPQWQRDAAIAVLEKELSQPYKGERKNARSSNRKNAK